MFLLVIASYSLVMFFEGTTLLKEKNKGKIALYFSLIMFSMIISLLLTFGVELPSPSNLIKNIVVQIFGKGD